MIEVTFRSTGCGTAEEAMAELRAFLEGNGLTVAVTPKVEPVKEETPAPAVPETSEPSAKEIEEMKVAARAALVAAKDAGCKMSELLKPYGDKFSEVHWSKLTQLREDAEKALAEVKGA